MKVSYVTTYDASNMHQWSGLGFFIAEALKKQQAELQFIGNLSNRYDSLFKSKQVAYQLLGKKYLRDREPVTVKHYARQVAQQLSAAADVVFSPGTIPLTYLSTSKPKVFYTDATFAGMINYYEGFSNLCRETIAKGHALEQQALDTCSLAIYSSYWAAESAVRHYKVAPHKVQVVPFGANIECNRTVDSIRLMASNKSRRSCHLLFLAVEWERKGGHLALETARLLNEAGLPTTLHVVGIHKVPLKEIPSYVKLHGFISKKTVSGQAQLNALIEQSHFLILPTRADCTPVVFSEAASFGLPVLSTNTGGIPTIIKNNINGRTFSMEATGEEYAAYVLQMFANNKAYNELTLSSFNEYESRLNWGVAGKQINTLLKSL